MKWKIVASTENFKTARHNGYSGTKDLEELDFCEDMLKLGFEPIQFSNSGEWIVFKKIKLKK